MTAHKSPPARQVLSDVDTEIATGTAAQRAARAVIASWVAEAARHRQRDRVRASLHARAGHDNGGPRRGHRIGIVTFPPMPAALARARDTLGCACCREPIGVTTSCEGGW